MMHLTFDTSPLALVASGEVHVRNEHATIQYRINGIMLPDGVAGLVHTQNFWFSIQKTHLATPVNVRC